MFSKIIRVSYYLLVILVPLVFLSNTSELFEFNKIIITYLLTVVMVLAWIAKMITTKRWIFRKTLLDWPLLIFLILQLLSLFFSIDMHTSWFGYYSRWNGGFFSLLAYALLYWGFVSNMDVKSTLRTLYFALGTAVLVCLWGVMERLGVDKDIWVQDVQNRVFSTLGQPNWLAAYITALIFIPVSNLKFKINNLNSNFKLQILNYAIFVLLFCVLLFTRSRSGLLGFGIAGAVFGYITLFRPPLRLRGGSEGALLPFGIVAALVIILTLIFPNPVRELIFKSKPPAVKAGSADTVLEVGGTESGNIRKIVWTGAIRIWQGSTKNFFLGTGPETFAMAYYQYRPIEHNQTTEWELLYNKAHNEFLNYLSTTGILGLLSYWVLLGAMAWILIRHSERSEESRKDWILRGAQDDVLRLALFAGWLTIPITNFWGFSVVIVQILMFLLPAFALVLSTEHLPAGRQGLVLKDEETGIWPFIGFCFLVLVSWIPIMRYWLADADLADSQKQTKYFQATQQAQYLMLAYQSATAAYKLNSHEPVIASEVSNSAAYLALAIAAQSTDSAKQLAQISVTTANQAIQSSPYHPNYYKAKARSLILLSDLDPEYLVESAKTLQAAMLISPTDPRLPYNLGVVYKYLDQLENAQAMFEKSLQLKPDFADPKKQLDEMTSAKNITPSSALH